MDLKLTFCVVAFALASCSASITSTPVQDDVYGMQGVRDRFVTINADFERLLGSYAQEVNVGSRPNAGDGDPLNRALDKVEWNLKTVEFHQHMAGLHAQICSNYRVLQLLAVTKVHRTEPYAPWCDASGHYLPDGELEAREQAMAEARR